MTGTSTPAMAVGSAAPMKSSSRPGLASMMSTGMPDAWWTTGTTRVAATNASSNAKAGAKPDPASASNIVVTLRPPSSTVTSMSAVMRGRPWTTAA